MLSLTSGPLDRGCQKLLIPACKNLGIYEHTLFSESVQKKFYKIFYNRTYGEGQDLEQGFPKYVEKHLTKFPKCSTNLKSCSVETFCLRVSHRKGVPNGRPCAARFAMRFSGIVRLFSGKNIPEVLFVCSNSDSTFLITIFPEPFNGPNPRGLAARYDDGTIRFGPSPKNLCTHAHEKETTKTIKETRNK